VFLANTDKLQAVTDSAATIDVAIAFADYDAAGVATVGRQLTALSSATTTDVLAAPASGSLRHLKQLHARNKHASLAGTVTLLLDFSGTDFEMWDVVLQPGEKIYWSERTGLVVMTALGTIKTSNPNVEMYTKKLLADQSNSTVTLTEVAGLTIPCGVGTWAAWYLIRYQAAALTTGVRFSVNHDGTVDSFLANRRFGAGTTASSDVPDQDLVAAGAQITSTFSARAKSALGWGTTVSVDTINADMLEEIIVLFNVTVAGNLELWHGSEVAAASTTKAGSALILTKVNG
jgi:hypothetical protein